MGGIQRVSIVACSFLLVAAGAAAQTANGVIQGRLTNGRGGPVAQVTVALTGPALPQPALATTGDSGEYQFDRLPTGVYRLTATAVGFQTFVKDGIAVRQSSAVRVDASLLPSATRGVVFDRRALDLLPAARDLWTLATLAPGVVMSSGVDVGGSASGQQLLPAARGAGLASASWQIDGLNITDLTAVGASKYYLDINAVESVTVISGGGDASVQTAGPLFQVALRSGADRLGASARYWFSNDSLQGQNVTPELFTSGAGAGVPLKRYREYGADIGGPVLRNRIWGWFGAASEEIVGTTLGFYQPVTACTPLPAGFGEIDTIERCLFPDVSRFSRVTGRATVKIDAAQTLSIAAGDTRKSKNARSASSLTQPESAGLQTGASPWFTVAHRWAVSPGVFLETRANRFDHAFDVWFQSPELAGTQVFRDRSTGAVSRSMIGATSNKRPTSEIAVDGTWSVPRFGPGRHVVSFGAGFRRALSDTLTHTGGNVIAELTQPGASGGFAFLSRDGRERTEIDHPSVHVQDSFALWRVRVNVGARWDRLTERALPSSVAANPIAPSLLPAAAFSGEDARLSLSDVAPRASAAFALDRDARTVAHAAYGVYFGQDLGLVRALSPTRAISLMVPWFDANRDTLVQPGEVVLGSFPSSLDPATGLARTSANTIDPDLRNSRTRETVLGVTRELGADLSVGVSYVRRTFDRFIWSPRIGESSALYVERPWTDPVTGLSSTYFEIAPGLARPPNVTNTENQPGRTLDYDGVDFSVRKRYHHRWALDAAITLQRSVAHLPPGSFIDPTDIDKRDGQPGDQFLPRFIVRIGGEVLLPAGFNAAAVVSVQDGFVRNLIFNGPEFRHGLPIGSTLMAEPFGTTRYPTVTMADLRIERVLAVRDRASVALDFVVYNLFNASTVFDLENNLSLASAGSVRNLVGPRVVRLGARLRY